jgi:hypothetical protein
MPHGGKCPSIQCIQSSSLSQQQRKLQLPWLCSTNPSCLGARSVDCFSDQFRAVGPARQSAVEAPGALPSALADHHRSTSHPCVRGLTISTAR